MLSSNPLTTSAKLSVSEKLDNIPPTKSGLTNRGDKNLRLVSFKLRSTNYSIGFLMFSSRANEQVMPAVTELSK